MSELKLDDKNRVSIDFAKKLPLHHRSVAADVLMAAAFAHGIKKGYRPYNWAEGEVPRSLYFGAAVRHLFAAMTGHPADAVDRESCLNELGHLLATIHIYVEKERKGLILNDMPVLASFNEAVEMAQAALRNELPANAVDMRGKYP